jgi:SAM-dependent methyltransferase
MRAGDAYFAAVASEWPTYKRGNLAHRLDFLFEDVPLAGASVLDVGAGDGLLSLWPAACGARRVVALEPEAAGSSPRVRERFERASALLGRGNVELRGEMLQEYEPPPEPFDVVMLLASINHLDEPACINLHRDPAAREAYRGVLGRVAELTAPGGRLIVTDSSRHNLFAHLPVPNPLSPEIEWDKHQPPGLWQELLEEAGFEQPRLRWLTLNSLRKPGRVLLGNRFAAWFLQSAFCLTMRRSVPPSQRTFRFRSGAREDAVSRR